MTRKVLIRSALVVLAAGAIGLWWYRRAEASASPEFRFGTVQRGTIRTTVAATGSLSAVRTVEVGTQASGQIAALHADFNDRVRKGQLIARIDPTLQQQAVADARAGVERAVAQLVAATGEFERAKKLREARVITDEEFETSQAAYLVAGSNARSARITLDRANRNLEYTRIYSPIDGVIVERDVDVGQTVAASLQAPKLFVIANDLRQMQILAAVDESDIGRIHEGQDVTFTVQSYAARSFSGKVKQVRLSSSVVNNVVSYTVVVAVPNPDGTLLPGMTATVTFVCDTAADVLTVPNAALRFQPAVATGGRAARTGERPTGSARNVDTLWVAGAGGTAEPRVVRVGLSDGARTQVEGAGLVPGLSVIVGTAEATPAPASTTTNPLQPANQRRGGPPGPF